MSNLESGRTTLFSLFVGRAFRVPSFQRAYAWERQQIRELIDDVTNVGDGRSHFLGTLLFMRPDSQVSTSGFGGERIPVFDVVDG
jgi:uncharacterized protein with ParB-like and HNH nuclease domain